MTELLRFLVRERKNLLHPRGVGDVAGHLLIRSVSHLLFHFHADRIQVESHSLKHAHSHPLAKLDQTKQEMLGSNVVVVESVCFFPR